MKFNDRIALVTGANGGIGIALVNALLSKGVAKIYAAARDTEKLPNINDNRIVPLQLDITKNDQVKKAAETANDIDLLINNAGIAAFSSLLDGPVDLIRRDMETNYYGTLDMVRNFVPVLETQQDARIVNIVTIAAFVNFPMIGGYSASKAALFSLSQGIRLELAPRGITVHTVNPGPIDTEMAREFPAEKSSPESTAENILLALEHDEADIFPDEGSRQMIAVWKEDYRKLEEMVSQMLANGH